MYSRRSDVAQLSMSKEPVPAASRSLHRTTCSSAMHRTASDQLPCSCHSGTVAYRRLCRRSQLYSAAAGRAIARILVHHRTLNSNEVVVFSNAQLPGCGYMDSDMWVAAMGSSVVSAPAPVYEASM